MKNFVQPGVNVDVVAPYARLSGEGMLVGAEFSIASTNLANGEAGVGVTHGVFTHAKAAVAITNKQVAYWDNAAKVVTNVAGGNTKIGIFQAAALAGDATATVKLIPTI